MYITDCVIKSSRKSIYKLIAIMYIESSIETADKRNYSDFVFFAKLIYNDYDSTHHMVHNDGTCNEINT